MGLKSNSPLTGTILRLFDVTQTKQINFRTWVTTLASISTESSLDERIKFSFSLYDQNNDGRIDKTELKDLLIAAVRENVISLRSEEIEDIVNHTLEKCDKDKNGTVEYSEYRDMVLQSPKFLEAFTIDVAQLCDTYRGLKYKHSLHLREEEAKKRGKNFIERWEKIAASPTESEETLQPPKEIKKNGGFEIIPPERPTRKKTHAPSEKDVDLDATVVDQRRLSELFEPEEIQAVTGHVVQPTTRPIPMEQSA